MMENCEIIIIYLNENIWFIFMEMNIYVKYKVEWKKKVVE